MFCRLLLITLLTHAVILHARQQLIIVCVIDQCSYDILQHIKRHFQQGIKDILQQGTNYEQALYPYGLPTTGPGHTSLSTGTIPAIHGIIANHWYTHEGKHITGDQDQSPNARILCAEELHPSGRSPVNILVDTLSDQLLLQHPTSATSIAISLKSRAAIAMAGRLGCAYWFDTRTGEFTSSNAYMPALPDWLVNYNKKSKISEMTNVSWSLKYDKNHPAYTIVNRSYEHAQQPSMVNKTTSMQIPDGKTGKFEIFARTPQSNKAIFDIAQEYLTLPTTQKQKKILVWLGLSSLDKVGHLYGPHSFEYIDTLYHIDSYLFNFMRFVQHQYSKTDITLVLTADHGNMPIIEQLEKQKLSLTHRIDAKKLLLTLNTVIEKKHGIKKGVLALDLPNIWLDHILLQATNNTTESIANTVVNYLLQQLWVSNAWTFEYLKNYCPCEKSFAQLFKNQLVHNRSGDVIVHIAPYCFCSNKPKGTGHSSPYNYDRHVPLVVHTLHKNNRGSYKKPVAPQQLTCTLAKMLHIPKPSASLFEPLPIPKKTYHTKTIKSSQKVTK